MLRSKEGDRLYRRIEVRIFFPPNTIPNAHVEWKSGPKQGYGPEGIDDILMQVADKLDTLYPWWDFKMTPIAPSGRVARYNFSVIGFRAQPKPGTEFPQFDTKPTSNNDDSSAATETAVGDSHAETQESQVKA